MRTTEMFNKPTAKKLNESFGKTYGQKMNLESFTLPQLEDARNRLRTQQHTMKSDANFNETVENEAHVKTQWMLDIINQEIADRTEVAMEDSDPASMFQGIETEEAFDSAVEEAEEDNDDSDESYGIYGYNFETGQPVRENKQTKGSNMTSINESELNKASAVVSAKSMVDKVSRWIEELAGMENDTLLTLGDSIRDEMGQESAKAFLSSVAPAIQQSLETLKTARETMASGVRGLTGEEQPEEMLGAPAPDMGEEPGIEPAPSDSMNPDEELPDEFAAPEDDFAAAEPAVGGAETAGREQRESIDRSSRLMKVLAG